MKSTAESTRSRLVVPVTLLFLVALLCGAGLAAVDKKKQPTPADRTFPVPSDPAEAAASGRGFSHFPATLPESPWTGKWLSAAPEQLGFDPEGLDRSAEAIGGMEGVYSLLVVRNGYLAAERYFREGFREKPHNLKSAAKSVLSALVGIAVDEGLLDPDQTICPLLPQCDRLDDPRKARITVRHLLTMTSGLAPTSYDAYGTWTANGDWVRNALNQPLKAEPGARHAYSTGDTHILSAVLTAATGKSTYDWAVEKLFDPLGITVHGWSTDPRGIYQGGNNLSLTPRDMAKIGLMYLSGGTFGGRRIVSKGWVDASTRDGRWDDNPVYGRYKYLWYSGPNGSDAFVAVGYGGQYIYVSPRHSCVVVVTATLITKGRQWEQQMFERIQNGILASVAGAPGPVLLAAGHNAVDGLYRASGVQGAAIDGEVTPGPMLLAEADLPDAAKEEDPDLPVGETRNNVVLRGGPAQESQRLGIVPAGQRVDILDTQGRWHLVLFDGKAGWLHGDYVNVPDPAGAPAAAPPAPGPTLAEAPAVAGEDRGWTRTRLKLRSGPGQDYEVLSTLDEGSPLRIEKKTGPWLSVRAGSQSGWVHAAYVRIEPADDAALARAPAVQASPQEAAERPLPDARTEDESPSLEMTAAAIDPGPEPLPVPAADGPEVPARESPPKPAAPVQVEGTAALEGRVDTLAGALEAVAADTAKTLETVSSQGDDLKAQKTAIAEMVLGQQQLGLDLAATGEKIQSMEKSLDLEQTSRQNLVWNLTKIIEELEDQREAGARYEASRKQMQSDITDIGARLGALGTSLDEARQPSSEILQTLAALRKGIEAGQAADTQAAGERKGLTEGLAELGGQLADQQAQMAALGKGIEAGQAADTQAAGERKGLTEGLTKLGGQLADQQAQMAALGKGIEAGQAAGTQAADARKGFTEGLAELGGQLADQQAQMVESRKAGKELAGQIADLRGQLTVLTEALSAAVRSGETMQAAVGTLQEAFKSRLEADARSAAAERETLKGEMASMREALADQSRSTTAVQSGQKTLAAELDRVSRQIEPMTQALQAAQTSQEMMRTEIDGLGRELKTRQDAEVEALSQRDALQAELAGIRREMADQNLLATQAETSRSAVAAEIVVVRNQVTDLGAGLQALRAELDRTRSEMTALETDLKDRRDFMAQAAVRPVPAASGSPSADQRPGTPPRTATAQAQAVPEGPGPGTEPEPGAVVQKAGPQAPAAADPPALSPGGRSPEREAVEPFIRSWADAWERKDVKAYLAHYSESFQPAGGIGLAQWKAQRKQRLLKPAFIEIDVADVRTEPMGADRVRVTLEQVYQSDTLIDRMIKVLDLKWESGGWRIMEEAGSKP